MEESKEMHRMRLDQLLNRAMQDFDNYFEEQEFAFRWDTEHEYLEEQNGYVTHFTAAPVNIRERSLEEQLTFIFLGVENSYYPFDLKTIGEVLYGAWMLSEEDVASFGAGPHHMLTETLPARIREEHHISVIELVDEALSVRLSKDSKNEVVDELVQRNIVYPIDEFYTIDGLTPFLRVGVRTRDHRPVQIRAKNAQRAKEFVQSYVPREIEKLGYVEIESIIDDSVQAPSEDIALFKQKEVSGLMRKYKGEERDTIEGTKNYVRRDNRNEIIAETQSRATESLPTIIMQTHTVSDDALNQALADIPDKYRERIKTGLVERMWSEGLMKTFETVYGEQKYAHNDNVERLTGYAAEIHETLKPRLQRWWENRKRVVERKAEERKRREEERMMAEEQATYSNPEPVAKPQDMEAYKKVVTAYTRRKWRNEQRRRVSELARDVPHKQRDDKLAAMVASSYLNLAMPRRITEENQSRVWRAFKDAAEGYGRQVPEIPEIVYIVRRDLRAMEQFSKRVQRSRMDLTLKNNIAGTVSQMGERYAGVVNPR